MVRRLLLLLLLAALGVAGCVGVLIWIGAAEPPPGGPAAPPSRSAMTAPPRAPPPAAPPAAACAGPPAAGDAAAANAASLTAAPWSVFGRPETGWSVYAPLISREVGTACSPEQTSFARALQAWQATHRLPATGAMTAPTLQALKLVWLNRRPFVAASKGGACPAPPPGDLLTAARPEEGYLGKLVRLHTQALDAYRRLVAAARAERPELAADPRLLTIVSAYRGPEEEAARCATSGACGGPSLARCSAHRTGMALDLFLDAEPGAAPASSDDANRAMQSRSPAYRWLVDNADRFGFVPYPFEPWHWEYTRADAPAPASPGGPSTPHERP